MAAPPPNIARSRIPPVTQAKVENASFQFVTNAFYLSIQFDGIVPQTMILKEKCLGIKSCMKQRG